MLRPNKKATRIAFTLLGVPDALEKSRKSKAQKIVDETLIRQNTKYSK
jgi:hypothetical protein